MGNLEKEAKKQRRLGKIQEVALAVVAIAGVLALTAVAPNMLQLLGGMGRNKSRFKNQSEHVLTRLAQNGHITFEEREGKRFARITDAGQRFLLSHGRNLFMLAKKPKRWDRRWRIVLFDIPEKRRKTRDALRKTMKSFGFYRLQDSVWVYPYDCEDVIALLKAELRVGAAALYMIVEKIENERHLKEEFLLH